MGGKVALGVDIDILAISSPCLKSSAVGDGGGLKSCGMGCVNGMGLALKWLAAQN